MIKLSDVHIYWVVLFLVKIAMTFCVILGLFILRGLALYILKMRICGARFSVARLKETIFVFFVLILR
jgi:hypothetical protein